MEGTLETKTDKSRREKDLRNTEALNPVPGQTAGRELEFLTLRSSTRPMWRTLYGVDGASLCISCASSCINYLVSLPGLEHSG